VRQVKDASAARQIIGALNDGAIKAGSTSPDEALSYLESAISRIAQGLGVKSNQLKTAEDAIREAMTASESAAASGGTAISTGYPDLDKRLGGGFYPQDLNIIAARSGEGKTALMLSLLANMAVPGVRMGSEIIKAGLFSLEMPTNQIVNRLMSQLTGIPAWRLRSGKLQDGDEWNNYYNAAEKVSRSGLLFDDTPGLSIPQLRVKVGRMVDLGVRIIGIDQLNFLTDSTVDQKAQEHIKLNIIAHKLKIVAREFGVCVLLNHQMNRSIEGRPDYEDPTLADLQQAGDQPASVVMFIRHKRAGEVYQSSWVYIAKNRDGAAGVRVPLVFLADKTRFENATQK
jgi:replicative DNA helicase